MWPALSALLESTCCSFLPYRRKKSVIILYHQGPSMFCCTLLPFFQQERSFHTKTGIQFYYKHKHTHPHQSSESCFENRNFSRYLSRFVGCSMKQVTTEQMGNNISQNTIIYVYIVVVKERERGGGETNKELKLREVE